MSNSDVDSLDATVDQARDAIARRDDLLALQDNKAFKNVINEGYLKNEATRTTYLLADPNMQDPEKQKSLQDQLMAIAQLRLYFRNIMTIGMMMEKTLKDAEAAIEEDEEEDQEEFEDEV